MEKKYRNPRKMNSSYKDIIEPFLNKRLNKNQIIELCNVAKFTTLLDKETSIVEHRDHPDFIISYAGEIIGLEHERILSSEKVQSMKSISKLVEDSAEVFKEKYPEIKLLASCRFSIENFSFRKKDAIRLKNEIADYIYSAWTNKISVEKPSFIDRVSLNKHSLLVFYYNPGAFWVKKLDKENLESAIKKKERLFEKYKNDSGMIKQWLLIVINPASPDSYEYGDNPFDIKINSNFERIFLMEDSGSKLWQLK